MNKIFVEQNSWKEQRKKEARRQAVCEWIGLTLFLALSAELSYFLFFR